MKTRFLLTLAAPLGMMTLAQAQTYFDSGSTIPNGVVPLVGCTPGGHCSGPVSSTNPMPVTVSGGGGGGGAITAASGSYASGALSSGSIASGAVSSGAIASGAYAVGSIASGAAVDGWNLTEGTKADGPCTLPASTTACSIEALLKANANAVNSAIPAGTNVIGYTSNDPCAYGLKSSAPFSLTASGGVITGTASKKTYICSIDISIGGTAQNVALVEGTGTVCATNIYGLAGGTTAATGWQFPANGGLTKGSGSGTVSWGSADTNATAANICLLLSSTIQTSGSIQYVQQ